MKKLNWRLASMFSMIGALAASNSLQAAGFQIRETSASMVGTAFAGSGSYVGDLTTMFNNPASITHFNKHAAAIAANVIIPDISFNKTSATIPATGAQITGDNGGKATKAMVIPAAYFLYNAKQRLKLGVGVTSPWGLKTEYNQNWVGRYRAIRSQLATVNINPVVAYQLSNMWSIAAGLQIQYMEAKISKKIDAGSLGAALGLGGFAAQQQDVLIDLRGNDWGWGGNLGVMFEPCKGTRFGLSYRSQVTHKLEGKATVYGPLGPLAAALPTSGTGIKSVIQTPETVNLSGYHDLTQQWAIMADVTWTHWNRFKELRINFNKTGVNDSVEQQNWKDTYFLSLGTQYKFYKNWKATLGVAYDQSPVKDLFRSPRLPDQDRYWVAVGLGYSPSEWCDLNLSYAHIFSRKATVNLPAAPTSVNSRQFDAINLTTTPKVDIIGIQASFKF